jgi:exoribonuclease R
VVCESLCAGLEIPGWARGSLHELPALMGVSTRRASQLDAASVARVEAAVLRGRVGERFDASVLELRGDKVVVQLIDPAVTASCAAPTGTRPGERITVLLESADIATGAVEFTPAR